MAPTTAAVDANEFLTERLEEILRARFPQPWHLRHWGKVAVVAIAGVASYCAYLCWVPGDQRVTKAKTKEKTEGATVVEPAPVQLPFIDGVPTGTPSSS